MGGEGSMMAANQSLKSNRNLLSKRKEKAALSGSYTNIELKEFPKSTPQMLHHIKQRLEEEQRRRMVRVFLVFGFIISMVVSIFVYFF